MASSWLITGGSSGIGLGIGRAVLAHGGKAVLTTRNAQKARDANPDVEQKGGKWLQLDFASPTLEQTVQAAITEHNVDVLVNNAGTTVVGAVEEINMDLVRGLYEDNLFAPIRLVQAAIPLFRQRKGGVIANVGSSTSYEPYPALSIYGSTKAAMRTFTEGLAKEVGPFGIRAIIFEPGRFRTNFGGNGNFVMPSPAYDNTPVGELAKALTNFPPAPGDPALAGERIYEVVTGTGKGAADGVKDQHRFPLGPDAHERLGETARQWLDVQEMSTAIATSTNLPAGT